MEYSKALLYIIICMPTCICHTAAIHTRVFAYFATSCHLPHTCATNYCSKKWEKTNGNNNNRMQQNLNAN